MNSRMTFGKKINLLTAGLVVLSLILGIVGLVSLTSLQRNIDTVTVEAMPALEQVGNMATGIYRYRGSAWKHIASTSDQEMAAIERDLEEWKKGTEKALSAYEANVKAEDDRANLLQLRQTLTRYYQAFEGGVRPISRQSRNAEAYQAYNTTVDPIYQELVSSLDKIVRWNSEYGRAAAAEAENTAGSARTLMYLALVVSVLVGSLASFLILRSLNRTLRQSIVELSDTASHVTSAAAQVASASQSLAQGASEQAASLEQTSASSEEINSMAQRNSENSGSANALVTQSQEKFVETNRALDQMVVAMSEIDSSSDKISKIIRVIEGIAFQTNILALNAAVEAARAGEAGMGFAVVADEVRNLAQRCAQAAKDTAVLIEESVSKSREGKTRVDQVAGAIRTITAEAEKVKTLVDEVSLGSREQSQGIEQVSKAIAQMQQVTQKSAAGAQESASAAAELTAHAETLKAVVTQMATLIDSGDTPVRNSRPAPSRHVPLQPMATVQPRSKPAAKSRAEAVAEAHLPIEEDDFKEF